MIKGNSYRVLLIEDDHEDAMFLSAQLANLSSFDFQIDHEVRLESGIALAKETFPNVILLDLNLPDSTGIETVERACKELPDVPIVVLTGLFDQVMENDAVNLGAQDYLIKGSFSDEDLLKSIQYSISRKDVEDQLRESESLMSTIFDDVPVIIIMLDENLKVLKINEAGLRLSHQKSSEVIGKDLGMAFGCQTLDGTDEICGTSRKCDGCSLVREVERTYKTKKRVSDFGVRLNSTKGKRIVTRFFTASASYLSSGNRPAILLTLNDISDLRKYQDELVDAKEKAEEANMLKTAFLSNMSHEIRTPLNAINGFAYLLYENEDTDSAQKPYLTHITNGVDQLISIVDNVVEMSKIQAGQLSLNPSECSPKALMLETYNQIMSQKHSQRIEINMELDIPGSLKIRTDPEKLRTVLTILTNNALKFTDEGFIHIRTLIIDNQLSVAVKDTGIGIPEKHLDDIFKGFYQVQNGMDKLYGGNGLGLTIAKHYIELLDGAIHVESTLNEGSEFIVSLPLKSE